MGEEPTRYLSTAQAAALLGLSPRTLDRYRVTGTGPPFLTYCNRIHYLRADLHVWAVEGRRLSTSDDGGAGSAQPDRGSRADRRRASLEARVPEDAARCVAASGDGAGRLSVAELAAALQVSRRTLDRCRARGEGPAFEKVDGRIVYARADVEAWLASGRRVSTSDADAADGCEAGDDAPEGA